MASVWPARLHTRLLWKDFQTVVVTCYRKDSFTISQRNAGTST